MASFNFTLSMAIMRGKQKTGKKSKQSKTKIMKNFLKVTPVYTQRTIGGRNGHPAAGQGHQGPGVTRERAQHRQWVVQRRRVDIIAIALNIGNQDFTNSRGKGQES